MLGGIKPIKVHRAEEHFLSSVAGYSAIVAQMFARVPIVANSARYLVEPLAFGAALYLRFWCWRPGNAISPISFRTLASWLVALATG